MVSNFWWLYSKSEIAAGALSKQAQPERPDVKSHTYYLNAREVWSKFDILAWANANSTVPLHTEHTVDEVLF